MKTPKPETNPLKLLPYQAAFAANRSRFKIGLWARQTGKDFTCAAEAVYDCLENPRTTWLIIAAGERQAIESLEKAKEWAEQFKFPVEDYAISSGTGHRNASAQIKWANGSRIIALPAKPETIRGYSANIILTEFAFHEDPDAIWRAVYPSITNSLRGGPKKLRIISTPNGLNNKFAHLWLGTSGVPLGRAGVSPAAEGVPPEASPDRPPLPQPTDHSPRISNFEFRNSPSPAFYFKSKLTIHDAIAHGLPLDAAELQAGLADPEAWSQEYLCEFTDNSRILLPYDLIESCETSLASETATPQSLSASILPDNGRAPDLFAGIDFARKNHLTVCWILERVSAPGRAGLRPAAADVPSAASSTSNQKCSLETDQSTLITREVLCLHNLPTPEQLQILLPRLQRCRKICLDYTGPGIGLGDYLQKELSVNNPALNPAVHAFRNYTHNLWRHSLAANRLELCLFTTGFKAELFPRLRAAFENRELQIPSSRDIREDLHSLYVTTTNTGQLLYRALGGPCGSHPGHHADRATALALALRAAQSAPTPGPHAAAIRRRSLNDIPPDPRYLPPKRLLAIIH